MKKRSKKRIPQDILPWVRVKKREDDSLFFFRKKTSRWTSGQSREWQTTLYKQQILREKINLNFKAFLFDQKLHNLRYKTQLQMQASKLNKKVNEYKPKNFCVISGKNRTYNRVLYITRQTLRWFSRAGFITGLIQ